MAKAPVSYDTMSILDDHPACHTAGGSGFLKGSERAFLVVTREGRTASPVVAAISVVVNDERVLLVRRKNPPDIGRWGFSGGKINSGETIFDVSIRELFEETQVRAEAQEVFTAVDVFDWDDQGRLRQHFVLVAVRCCWVSGEPIAGDDAMDARWFRIEELSEMGTALSMDVVEVALIAAST